MLDDEEEYDNIEHRATKETITWTPWCRTSRA
jgi:hypothetical protein